MSRRIRSKEDQELEEIRATEQELLKREQQSTEQSRRLAQKRSEQDSMMPPLAEVQERTRRIQHEICVSRGEVTNMHRAQNRSLLLLLMLVAMTCGLVWWGMSLMQGG
jgi:NADH:ubiquinone oxidoreductase subunit E